MDEKLEYFPRKAMFEEAQDLIATFYSSSEKNFTEEKLDTATFLDEDGNVDTFYYNLLLFALISSLDGIIKLSSKIIRNIKFSKIIKKVNSNDEILGEIDIERYIQKNYVEKVFPKEYPSIVKMSTYQIPEYQITKYIMDQCALLLIKLFDILGYNRYVKVGVFTKASREKNELERNSSSLRNKYGVNYRNSDSYLYLKKKVIYRYRNHKIIDKSYLRLMKLYENIFKFNGLNFDSDMSYEFFQVSPDFDDRLFEIWLLKKLSFNIAERSNGMTKYTPLYKARESKSPAIIVEVGRIKYEFLFQNRVGLLDNEHLKWYFYENGKKNKIGAIPDIVVRKVEDGVDKPLMVLLDAKNRTWNIPEDTARIKPEVVQQIYIQSNFTFLFEENFKSVLIAHNIRGYQKRIFRNLDNENFEISATSLDFRDSNYIKASLESLTDDLLNYLGCD